MSELASEPREEVGLDDLFGQEAGPGAGGRRDAAGQLRWLLGRTFLAVALGAVTFGMCYVAGYSLSYPLLVLVFFVMIMIRDGLRRAAVRRLPDQLTGRCIRPVEHLAATGDLDEHTDGVAQAVGRWDHRLRRTERDAGRYARIVAPRLGELVDQRLRLRRGFTRASDPRRARETMGEHLWTMLHDPPPDGPTLGDMAPLVTRIEQL